MAKKGTDFTSQDAQSVGTVEELRSGADTATVSAAERKRLKAKNGTAPQFRFTARFTEEEWNYLEEKHWRDRTSVTDILRTLVQADMKKHPEILESIDELNKK